MFFTLSDWALTLLIVAYNEESVIAQRVENALATDYPADRLRVVVASDGSTDLTAATWIDITQPPSVSGAEQLISVLPSGGRYFFRLRKL